MSHDLAVLEKAPGTIPGDDIYDITIIGAGPTGQFAAFYAGLRGARTQVIDALEEPGGALTAIYPEKYIYDVIGFPRVLAKDFVAHCDIQARQADPTIRLKEQVLELEVLPDGLIRLGTTKGNRWSRTVIVCAGVGAFEPKRIDVPGIRDLEGRGVHYFAKRVEDFRNRNVVIVGGGDSAVDWAVMLEPVASQVTMIHRSRFRAHEAAVRQLESRRLTSTTRVARSHRFIPVNLATWKASAFATPPGICEAYQPTISSSPSGSWPILGQ